MTKLETLEQWQKDREKAIFEIQGLIDYLKEEFAMTDEEIFEEIEEALPLMN